MDIHPLGILILMASGAASFVLGRWFSRRHRSRKQERERIAREAAQSRQVRRANQRRNQR